MISFREYFKSGLLHETVELPVPGSQVSSSPVPYLIKKWRNRENTVTLVMYVVTLFITDGIWIREDIIEGSVITGTPKSATSSSN